MREGRHNRPKDATAHLTPREREVLDLLTSGMGPAEIAARLSIGYDTVQSHLAALRSKCGARSTLELAVKAARERQT